MGTSQQLIKFEDYDGFVEKFKPKKTTDDCYTPPEIYDEVLRYVGELVDLTGRPIVRPFYPGGDYEAFDYPENCVVIDNPPFSCYAKIVRFYLAHHIDFFLFAPALTQPVYGTDVCYIVCAASVVYENGADIPTSFTTSLLPGIRVKVDGELCQRLEALKTELKPKANLKRYQYPNNVTTAALLSRISERGLSLIIPSDECTYVRHLDNWPNKNNLFGAGFLLSERMAAEKAAAVTVHKIELSERERAIVASMC